MALYADRSLDQVGEGALGVTAGTGGRLAMMTFAKACIARETKQKCSDEESDMTECVE